MVGMFVNCLFISCATLSIFGNASRRQPHHIGRMFVSAYTPNTRHLQTQVFSTRWFLAVAGAAARRSQGHRYCFCTRAADSAPAVLDAWRTDPRTSDCKCTPHACPAHASTQTSGPAATRGVVRFRNRRAMEYGRHSLRASPPPPFLPRPATVAQCSANGGANCRWQCGKPWPAATSAGRPRLGPRPGPGGAGGAQSLADPLMAAGSHGD